MNTRCALALLGIASLLSACSDHLAMEMKGDMNLNGQMAVKIEGPIEMKVDGPTIHYKGTYVSDKALAEVVEGRTTGEWVVAVFGEPDVRVKLSDGSEIWKWQYRPTEETAMAFSLFGGDKDKPRTPQMLAFVQIRDGIVIHKFRD